MKKRLQSLGATGLCLLVGLVLTGCLNLKPVADTTRFFVLEGVASAPKTGVAANTSTPLRLGLGPVQLPEYLRRTEMVVRHRSGEVDLLENLRWGEGLDQGIQRTTAVNLARLLQTREFELNSWTRETVDWEIYVDVFRCEADEQGLVTLVARWRVGRPGVAKADSVGLFQQTAQAPPATEQPEPMVEAINGLLARLAESVAAALRESSAPGP